MNYLLRNIILTLVLTFVVVTPVSSFADSKNRVEKEREKIEKRLEKQKEKEEKRSEKLQEKLEKKLNKNKNDDSRRCWNSFFHRVLPFSWLTSNLNNINLDDDCFFGIHKATTTPDITAPTITNITTKTGQKRALILWNTNEKTRGKIYYSTSTPVNIANSSVVSVNKQVLGGKDHYVVLNNLVPGTNYYGIIEAKDKAGNTATSSEFQFITKTATTTTDTLAPNISSTSIVAGTSTIKVLWNTNENATSKVYYSTSTPLNISSASFTQSGTFVTSHNLTIEGLSTSTLYYLVIESSDSSANTATSSQFSLTTSP